MKAGNGEGIKMTRPRWTVFLLALLCACSEKNPGSTPDSGLAAGTEGGPCFPNNTCNAGLVCKNGTCVKATVTDGGRDAPLADRAVPDVSRPDLLLPDLRQPDASPTPPTWSAMPTLSKDALWGVWGSGPSDVYVVGDGGTILHHDGRKPTGFPWWTAMKSSVGNTLYGVWGSGASDVFVVGDRGTILHYGACDCIITKNCYGAGDRDDTGCKA
jgi:hypothetical protein